MTDVVKKDTRLQRIMREALVFGLLVVGILAIGDHRGNSLDGRIFGAVPEDEIYGRAIAIYYRRGAGFRWRDL